VLDLLGMLRNDTSTYAGTSAANAISDVSETFPDVVLAAFMAWLESGLDDAGWLLHRRATSGQDPLWSDPGTRNCATTTVPITDPSSVVDVWGLNSSVAWRASLFWHHVDFFHG